MARNEIEVTVKGKDQLSGTLDAVEKKTESTGRSFSGMGDKIGDVAKDKLGVAGEFADKLGVNLDGIGPAGAVAGAAIGAVGGFVASSIGKFLELTDEVKNYKSATGLATEEASRFNSVFKQFGVESEDGIDVFKTLAEEAGSAPEKFAAYHIEIAKAADGSTDMAATMKNVADRFKDIQDPARRAALGADIFGDSWVKIAPILEKGGDNLDELLASVEDSAVVTDKSMKKAEEYRAEMHELKQTFEDLQLRVGEKAIPILTDALGDLAGGFDAVVKSTEKIGAGGLWEKGLFDLKLPGGGITNFSISDLWKDGKNPAPEIDQVTAARERQEAAEKELIRTEEVAKDRADAVAKATEGLKKEAEDAANAVKEQKSQLDQLNDTMLNIVGTNVSYQAAVDGLSDSESDLAEKAKAADEAVRLHGAGSKEAKDAAEEYDDALRNATGAADDQARATADLYKNQAEANGVTYTAEQYASAYREALRKTSDSTNDPNFRNGLQNLVNQLDNTANRAYAATYYMMTLEAAASRAAAAASGALQTNSAGQFVGSADSAAARIAGRRAGGGPVNAGSAYIVGEEGAEVFVPSMSGTIIPNGGGGGSSVGGGGNVYNFYTLSPREAAEMVARAMADAKRYGLIN